jgi:alpha-D-ribose 1-methylphosphonate 5-triphosphate synthase subunit PhnH
MNALARPGRLYQTPPFPDALLANPSFEGIVRTLLDQSCGFAVASCALSASVDLAAREGDCPRSPGGGGSDGLAARVSLMTSATRVEPERAHFALITSGVPHVEQAALIERLTGGTALSPERGATAIVECQRLSVGADRFLWQVKGPGVESCHHFASSEDAWFAARLLRHDEFPCGIDLILVDGQGNLVGLPRTAQVGAVAPPPCGEDFRGTVRRRKATVVPIVRGEG